MRPSSSARDKLLLLKFTAAVFEVWVIGMGQSEWVNEDFNLFNLVYFDIVVGTYA